MKKLFLFFALTIISMGVFAQMAADSIAVNIQNPPVMPATGAGWIDWVLYAVGVFIIIGQVLVKLVPTAQSTHIFQVIYKVLNWIYNLGNMIPDKKKGGGKH